MPASAGLLFLEHNAEKCARFSDDIMLYFFDLDQDSDFRPIGPKIVPDLGHGVGFGIEIG
ncbi:hypothetical protein HFO35_05385 [Rhizobium leguminosarum]|nr:hypothetical protein [Rhizobium leguminosarum]MBY5674652.1 hypothetical protein [Rhizobium leguminosarum]NKK78756.1 hypothetical protein [Rhizobium leguminosarum bv. viciae]